MTIFKCKMCGGTLEFNPGDTVAVCDSCGTKQTLPKLDDDRRANLYDRANHFRRSNEYDKAMGIYEQILAEDNTDAEAYWSLVLCRYGIEYVEDPATHKRVPTVNRAQFTSIFDDDNYKSALHYADAAQREVYESEAKAINEIQKGILAISQKEQPFDVFICYKETDNSGRRTPDSVLANDLYHQLTQEGFKVFFARITLEDKLGTAYEPYIFAALNSAKVMVVLGTKPEYFNAVWVKNEWSRYLALVKNSGGKKMLIPAYKDMDPYDLPEEFSHLQAQDMGKLGFMQDLIRGIKKIISADAPKAAVKETVVVSGGNAAVEPLLKRAFMFLEDGNWQEADTYCEKVLDQDPENAQAYLGKLMAGLQVRKQAQLSDCEQSFEDNGNYLKILRFGDKKLQNALDGYISHIKDRNETARLTGIYNAVVQMMESADSEDLYKAVASKFQSLSGFKDADELAQECLDKAEACRKDEIYNNGCSCLGDNTIGAMNAAIQYFKSISGWKDADEKVYACQRKAEEIRAKEEADRLEAERKAEERRIAGEKAEKKLKKIVAITAPIAAVCIAFLIVLTTFIIPNNKYNAAIELMDNKEYEEAIASFEALDGYKDSADKIAECKTAISDNDYNTAIGLMSGGKYEEAIAAFEALDGYKDSTDKIAECKTVINDNDYNAAVELMSNGKYEDAVAAFEALGGYKDSPNKAIKCYAQYMAEKLETAKTGDYVTFGSYEQDNNTSNGKEDIEWLVLAKEGDKTLLISRYALDCQQYDISYNSTWDTCSLCRWLNGTFTSNAFSLVEQGVIQNTTVTADRNPKYSTTDPGNATDNKVFLLSINEVERYFSSDSERACKPTEYAVANGAEAKRYSGTCSWWLRSPGEGGNSSTEVNQDGRVNYYGYYVQNDDYGVRPAMWISLK